MDFLKYEVPELNVSNASSLLSLMKERDALQGKLMRSIQATQMLSLLTKTPYVKTSIQYRALQMQQAQAQQARITLNK